MRGPEPGAGAGAGAGLGSGWGIGKKNQWRHNCAAAGLLLLLGPGMQHRFLDCQSGGYNREWGA